MIHTTCRLTARFAAFALLAVGSISAQAAGMATHAAMADFGRDALEDGPLKTVLTAHRPALLAGAIYPDGGYGSGAAFPEDRDMAERAHWGDFVIHFIEYLRDTGCGAEARTAILKHPPVGTIDLNLLSDRCGHLIAFAFGDAAHGLGDELWDAQFEPEVRHRGETPNSAEFLANMVPQLPASVRDGLMALYGATPLNAIEYAMDMVNIAERHLQLNAPTLVFPPSSELVEVYRRNRPDQGVTAAMIERGNLVSRGAVQAESAGAALEVNRIRQQMPWASANYYTSAGGVAPSGYAMAGMYRQLWDLLTGDPSKPLAPYVIAHYPGHNAQDVRLEASGDSWEKRRWLHVFLSASVDPDSLTLPGALCLFDETGQRVEATIEPGIYQREYTHTAKFRLPQALKPAQRYTAVLTTKVRDYKGLAVARPYSWSFVTASD
jgi:hypothetical protein